MTVPALERLLDAVWSIPAPTSPPPTARDDQAFGLALLDLSLRLQHVSRISERLRLVDRGHLERTVGLDLDLTVLGHERIETLQPRPGEAGRGGDDHRGWVWVPIARHRRRDVTPVLVRSGADVVLPRMTHHETTARIAAGLIRLFRLLLATDPDSTVEGHPLHELRHEHHRSRWLIEHAVMTLIDDGGSGHLRDVAALAGAATREPVPRAATPELSAARARGTDAYSIRARAAEALQLLLRDELHPFPHLLDVAAGEYLVVVLVPRAAGRLFVSYDAPLLPARRPDASARTLAKSLLPLNREFTVEYAATVPRAVRSYHVTVDVPDEVLVRRFAVSSDVDAPLVEALLRDMDAVAAAFGDLDGASGKLLELELQAIASRLAELGRRRTRDVTDYRRYLSERAGRLGRTPERPPAPRPLPADEVVRRMAAGDCSPSVLGAFAGHYEADGYRHLAEGVFTADALRGIAAGLEAAEIGRDLTVDNDPRENGGHAHWRPPIADPGAGSLEPVRATAYLALADETPSLVESVSRIIFGLTLVVFGIGALMAGTFEWLFRTSAEFDTDNADAIVAVLLIVPGILVARLDIPNTNTVLGQIRSHQRALAYTAVVATTALAMAIAASPGGEALVIFARGSLIALVLLLAACGVEFVARSRRRRARIAPSETLPAWLHLEMGGGGPRRLVQPDARFDAVEGT